MYFTPALRGVCELRHVAAPMLSRRRLGALAGWCCGASQIISSERRARQWPRSTPRNSQEVLGSAVCSANAVPLRLAPIPCDRCVRQTVLNRWPRRDDRRSRGAHPDQRMRAMGAARWQCRDRSMRKCCRQSNAKTRDRAGDLQIFSLTLSQLSYRGSCTQETSPVTWTWASLSRSIPQRSQENQAQPPRASSASGHGASKIIPQKRQTRLKRSD